MRSSGSISILADGPSNLFILHIDLIRLLRICSPAKTPILFAHIDLHHTLVAQRQNKYISAVESWLSLHKYNVALLLLLAGNAECQCCTS